MNERIKQLATEVGISVEYLNNTKQWPLIEALTELIVQECGEVAYRAYWDNPETVRGTHIKEAIRKHFGVGE